MMKKVILISCVTVAGLIITGLIWLNFAMDSALNRPLNIGQPVALEILPGTSLRAVSSTLVDRGWLNHPYYLIIEAKRRGIARAVKVGEYEIHPGTTPLQLLDLLVSGKVIQYSLTIPEGWTFKQMLSVIKQNEHLIQTLTDIAPENIMTELGFPGQHPEGRFFPDTYHFPAKTTDKDFLLRAYRMMEKILDEAWQSRAVGLPYQTPYEALIMASIIEKETAVPEERSEIAGVFVRRLEKKMKLQTDPTIIYALGASFDGDIRSKDMNIDSPYNTYLYRGLPPTPIALPGKASIQAALNPEAGTALYFVAMGDGRHYFSDTLAEHNKAISKYQLKE